MNIYFPQAKFHKIRIFCWIAWVTLVYTRVLLTREVTCCKDTSYYCIVIDSGTNAHGDDKMFTAKLYILSLVLICSTLSYHFIIWKSVGLIIDCGLVVVLSFFTKYRSFSLQIVFLFYLIWICFSANNEIYFYFPI